MGSSYNYHSEPGSIRQEEIDAFMKPGITTEDLVTLKNAFLHLDRENKGYIIYDVNRIGEIGREKIKCDEEGKVRLSYEQFMEIMTNNIINNRKEYGPEKIKFESETSSAMCFVCPFTLNERKTEYRPLEAIRDDIQI